MIGHLFAFVLVGIFSKFLFSLLVLPYQQTLWKKGFSKNPLWFTLLQIGKMLVVAILIFVWDDLMLIDHTWQRLVIYALIFFLIVGLIRLFTNQVDNKIELLGLYVSIISAVGIICYILFFLVYGFTLAKEKYNLSNVHIVEQQKSVSDITHMITVSKGVASQRGDAVVNGLENSSYYDEGEYELSNINGTISYISPVEFGSFFRIGSAGTTPGVIEVNAENPNDQGKIQKSAMKITNSNVFSNNLERILRNKFPKKLFFGIHTEVDDKGKPYHVVSTGHYEKFRALPKVDGVILVDPSDGTSTYYPTGKQPVWVDKVFTKELAHKYWEYWGRYKHGWLNQSIFGGFKDVYSPVRDTLQTVVNENGDILYVTDFVREKKSGTSKTSIGVGVFDAKTGEMTYYPVKNLITSADAIDAVNDSEFLQRYKNWEATFATYYYIEGQPTYLVPVVNGSNKYQGIALVNGNANTPLVVFGKTKEEAFLKYENAIASIGKGNGDPSQKAEEVNVSGIVEIAEITVTNGESLNLIVLKGDKTIYTIDPKSFPTAAVTLPGHSVHLTVLKSGDFVESVTSFTNDRFK